MKQIHLLTDKSIYPIRFSDGVTLLYAPLADCVLEVTDSDVARLADVLNNPETNADDEAREIIRELTDVIPIPARTGYVAKIADFNNFTILPTNKCNFSCSFCYSRAGRGKESLDFGVVRNALDWYVKTCRKPGRPLHITFYGGGEPMILWDDVVLPALRYIETLKTRHDVIINVTLITNGSILPKEAVKFLKSYNVDVAVSFEVIENLQNIHRRNYQAVAGNIWKLIDNGISPRINAVITPDSVGRQREIIESLHSNFPSIDYISLEPECAVGLPASFYSQFIDSFLEIQERAKGLGITVTCSALRNCDVTIDRYCAGELALTPTGKLTLCPCISSESQPGFDQWTYGHADENGVEIDHIKLHQLLNMNLSTMPHCDNCFARYNCGGGCLNNFIQNHNRHDEQFCTFTRDFLKRILRKRYDQYSTK